MLELKTNLNTKITHSIQQSQETIQEKKKNAEAFKICCNPLNVSLVQLKLKNKFRKIHQKTTMKDCE